LSGGVRVGGDQKERVSPTYPVQVLTKVLYIQSTRKKKESLSKMSGPSPHKGSLYPEYKKKERESLQDVRSNTNKGSLYLMQKLKYKKEKGRGRIKGSLYQV
jgi:hypothetical protein